NGLDSEHTYEAHPAGWLLQLRPTSFYWQDDVPADCGSDRCVEAISSVGNPVVWWLGIVALAVVLWMAVVRRDWRAWVALAGYGATYLPWLAYTHRTIFTFYTIALAPYVALALVLAIAWVTGLLPPLHRPARRSGDVPPADDGAPHLDPDSWAPGAHRAGSSPAPGGDDDAAQDPDVVQESGAPRTGRPGHLVLGVVCLLAVAAFVYFWPVWTGATISYDEWHSHMWLGSWV